MDRITCRTCLSVADVDECFQIIEHLDNGINIPTIKDVLLKYVPQMEPNLSDKDRICTNCFETLNRFSHLVNRCIEIEEQLQNDQIVIENIESEDEEKFRNQNIEFIEENSSSDPGDSSTIIIGHDHDYTKYEPKNESTNTDVESQSEEVDGLRNVKLVSVATDTDAETKFLQGMKSKDSKLLSKITVVTDGEELLDTSEISVKQEVTNDSSMDTDDVDKSNQTVQNKILYRSMDGKDITFYESLEEEEEEEEEEVRFYVCDLCGDGFRTQRALAQHYLFHGEIRLMCDKCPKIFKTDSALKAHFRLKHTAFERFKCEICNQMFARADYLRNHVRRHVEDKERDNTKCKVPGKFLRFKNSDDPVPCKICGKYYNGIQKLKVHLQTHLVVKRFACEYCDLTYKRWPSLKRHEKTHLESSTAFHRCNVCWKRFGTKEELTLHMSHHGNPRYRCQVCDEQFHRKYLFDDHYLMKHATPEDIENSKKEVIYDTLLELSSQNVLIEDQYE